MPLSLFRYSNIPEIGTTALGNAESIFEKSIWKSSYPFFYPIIYFTDKV